ncbi:MAG: methyltransferase domain-containing protein [Microbacteriaceae bacterium]|nr:methyltransferase domain-containing protein [Microbacteriaceae bacterium]MCL2796266.1 methyltransferase domain-containing protein [Microbacteriaceae bacterium]
MTGGRAIALAEVMDGPCDERRLFATYRHFALANRVVSGWRRVYVTRLRPLLRNAGADAAAPVRLLDVGFGGGDIPRALAAWAAADRLPLAITAVDPDERALRFATLVRAGKGGAVRYLTAGAGELRAAGERFDIVVSNHVLHHLGAAEVGPFLDETAALATRLVLHDDIERSRTAYGLWAVGALPFALDSYGHVDGLRSIRRSYTAAELAAVVPAGWAVERAFPWRLILTAVPTEE